MRYLLAVILVTLAGDSSTAAAPPAPPVTSLLRGAPLVIERRVFAQPSPSGVAGAPVFSATCPTPAEIAHLRSVLTAAYIEDQQTRRGTDGKQRVWAGVPAAKNWAYRITFESGKQRVIAFLHIGGDVSWFEADTPLSSFVISSRQRTPLQTLLASLLPCPAQHSSRGLTPACSGLATLAADARR